MSDTFKSALPENVESLVDLVREEITNSLNSKESNASVIRESLRNNLLTVLRRRGIVITTEARDGIISVLEDEILGMGPIQQFMRDAEISEIMINSPEEIYIEKRGAIFRADISLRNTAYIYNLAERIVAPIGLRVDESRPYVDARLSDGSRVNIVVPPVSRNSPIITIRKFKNDPFRLEDLELNGSLSAEARCLLSAAIVARMNILVSGGASSGKTTLLSALCALIPSNERIIVIEDTAELRIRHPHIVYLESRLPNMDERGLVSVRDLVRNSLRMRPDRLIVGEVRGSESIDMLQAMNTGHEGSVTTIHANSAGDSLSRLESMALVSEENFTERSVRRQIASAIDIIVQMDRASNGKRFVKEICVVVKDDDGMPLTKMLYEAGCDKGNPKPGNRNYVDFAQVPLIEKASASRNPMEMRKVSKALEDLISASRRVQG